MTETGRSRRVRRAAVSLGAVVVAVAPLASATAGYATTNCDVTSTCNANADPSSTATATGIVNSTSTATATDNSTSTANAAFGSNANSQAKEGGSSSVFVAPNQNGKAKSKNGGIATVNPLGVNCVGDAKAKLKTPGTKKQKC